MVPTGEVAVRRRGFGPFVTLVEQERPGEVLERWESRRHRKQSGREAGGSTWWAPRARGWWIGVLFAVGSILFALGAVPGFADAVGITADAVTFFVGSLFFTAAGFLQYREVVDSGPDGPPNGWRRVFTYSPQRIDWWATAIQLVGTIFFNVSTGNAMRLDLTRGSHPVPSLPRAIQSQNLLTEPGPADRDKVRAALNRIINDSRTASEVFDGIRGLFRRADGVRQPFDVNEITLEVLASLRGELKKHGVTTHTELASELPPVEGHKGQLQQVISNLVHNAIEAMGTTTDRRRVLRVKTELRDGAAIGVAVEDTGPGFDPQLMDRIFEAFVTTKAEGMGLGLAICRRIIETHGGQLSAVSDGKNGAQFRFVLPIGLAG